MSDYTILAEEIVDDVVDTMQQRGALAPDPHGDDPAHWDSLKLKLKEDVGEILERQAATFDNGKSCIGVDCGPDGPHTHATDTSRRGKTGETTSIGFSATELEEIAEWANAFMGDAPEAFDDGSPGRSAYEKVQVALGELEDGD